MSKGVGEMRTLALAVAGFVSVLFLGCAAPTVKQYFIDHALDRAAFETRCPKNELEIVQLGTPLDENVRPGSQVGLKGCGRQSVYIFVRGTGWVLNSTSDPDQPKEK
jgi:hypothetical protein